MMLLVLFILLLLCALETWIPLSLGQTCCHFPGHILESLSWWQTGIFILPNSTSTWRSWISKTLFIPKVVFACEYVLVSRFWGTGFPTNLGVFAVTFPPVLRVALKSDFCFLKLHRHTSCLSGYSPQTGSRVVCRHWCAVHAACWESLEGSQFFQHSAICCFVQRRGTTCKRHLVQDALKDTFLFANWWVLLMMYSAFQNTTNFSFWFGSTFVGMRKKQVVPLEKKKTLCYRFECWCYIDEFDKDERCWLGGEDCTFLQRIQESHHVGRPGSYQHLLPFPPR